MAATIAREPVTTIDSAWLHMEEAANHMVVTVVLVFERRMPYRRIKELVEERLLPIPRFRQRIVPSLFPFSAPCWEDDPFFDVDRHLHVVPLDHSSDESAALRKAVSGAMSRPLDPSHPLWRFDFVPRYHDGCALITRIHHCIGDGFGLIYAFLSMCDDPDAVRASMNMPPCTAPEPAPGVVGTALAMTDGVVTTAQLLLMSSERPTSLKGPLVVEKNATWSTPVPLAQVKAVSRAMGASINDVLLTAVTGALRQYLMAQQAVSDDADVRGVLPVNLRRNGDAPALGNRFGLAFLSMPVGVADPVQRLFEIRKRTRALKQSQQPAVTYQILRAIGIAPGPVFDFVVTLFGRKATAVVTNVAGPREAITYAGVRLAEVMFWVPCAGKLGLGISILSYAGRVSIGFASDAGLIPRPEQLVQAFDAELAQLFEYAVLPV